jgi:hypothetical protein
MVIYGYGVPGGALTLKRPPSALGPRRPPGVKSDPTMKMVITNANRLEIVLGRPLLLGIHAKESIVVFYRTLSPQKCKKTKYRKTRNRRSPRAKCDPREEKSKFSKKRLSSTAKNHYADLEDTVVTKSRRLASL